MQNNNTLVVTPSNVNGLIKRLIGSEKKLSDVAVRGEITNLRVASSGHCYFSLSDGVSKLNAAVWKNNYARLKEKLEEGLSVICRGNVTVYEEGGTYSLSCIDVSVEGEGAQSAALEELAKKLRAEGFLDRKRPLPEFPQTVAVITSPSGAAVHDIEETLRGRYPFVKMLVIPSVVQGENAPDSIVSAFEYAQTTDADVIIFGRGGGASEDLSAFNSEKVVRAVFASRIPTISAVGHEIDRTLSDLVADRAVPTPTAAAIAAVPDFRELMQRISALKITLSDRLDAKISKKSGELNSTRHRLNGLLSRIYNTKERELSISAQNIKRLMTRRLEIAETELLKNRELISALNPLSTLKRGYSIVKSEGRPITDAGALSAGDQVEICFNVGSVTAVIEEVRK